MQGEDELPVVLSNLDDTLYYWHILWAFYYFNWIIGMDLSYDEVARIVRTQWLSIKMEANIPGLDSGSAHTLVAQFYRDNAFMTLPPTPEARLVVARLSGLCQWQVATGNDHVDKATILAWCNAWSGEVFTGIHKTGLFGSKLALVRAIKPACVIEAQAVQAVEIASGGHPVVLIQEHRWSELPADFDRDLPIHPVPNWLAAEPVIRRLVRAALPRRLFGSYQRAKQRAGRAISGVAGSRHVIMKTVTRSSYATYIPLRPAGSWKAHCR